MIYRIFLYRTTAASIDAPAVGLITHSINEKSEEVWKHTCADHYMENFDAFSVIKELEVLLGSDSDPCRKCRIVLFHSPERQKEILKVVTSYDMARKVLPVVYSIAQKNGLVMFDQTNEKSFYYTDLYNSPLIKMRSRAQKLNQGIRDTQKPLKRIRLLEEEFSGRFKSVSYVVTISKDFSASFLDRTDRFYNFLKSAVEERETITCEDRCFKISNEEYTITYCLEGYKKSANKIGFVTDGIPQEELINRMGCETAFKHYELFDELEREDTLVRMGLVEMQEDYPNPADRFVRSVNITKELRKETFDIRYGSFGYYGSEMLFYLVEPSYPFNELGRSVLKIEEESARYILPIINDFYPYIGARHYTSNYIPYQMWQDIIKRINEIKELIINDTYNDKLAPYIDKFNLFVLSKNSEDNDLIHNDEMRFVYEHRYKIAHLYDIFLQWLDRQLFDEDCIINVQGP